MKNKKEFIKALLINVLICVLSYFLYDHILGYCVSHILLLGNFTEYINIIISIFVLPSLIMHISDKKYYYTICLITYFSLVLIFAKHGYMNILGGETWIDLTPIWLDSLIFSIIVCSVQKLCYVIIQKVKNNNKGK